MKIYKFWETLDFKKFPDGTRFKDNEGEIWEIASDNKENSCLYNEKTNRMITGTLENAKKEFTLVTELHDLSFDEVLSMVSQMTSKLKNKDIKVKVEHEFIREGFFGSENPEWNDLSLVLWNLSSTYKVEGLIKILLEGKWSINLE